MALRRVMLALAFLTMIEVIVNLSAFPPAPAGGPAIQRASAAGAPSVNSSFTPAIAVNLLLAAVEGPSAASDDSYAAAEGPPLAVAAPGVLGDARGGQGGPLTAALVSDASRGVPALGADGGFGYPPEARFTYQANDGLAGSNVATASIAVLSPGAALTLTNRVTNDNGGAATAQDFQARIDLAPAPWEQVLTLEAGGYTVSMDALAGYAASAWGGDCAPDGAVSLAEGEHKTCSITNDDIAPTITVIKALVPSADPGRFNLRIDGVNAGTGVGVGDGGTTGPVQVLANTSHRVGEVAVAGTVRSNYVQAIGGDCNPDGTITPGLGDNAVCVITNTRKGTIVIQKQTEPDGAPEQFHFYGAVNGDIADGAQLTASKAPGTYTVTEANPAGRGFTLTGLVCDDGDSATNLGARRPTVNLAAGETVKCVFTNSRKGTIIIEKQTEPESAPEMFRFYGAVNGNVSDGGQLTATKPAGVYTVTEGNPKGLGFTLTDLACDDGDSATNLGARRAAINLAPGETVKCVFTNTSNSAPKSLNPTELENQQPGSDGWQIGKNGYQIADDTAQQIKGYASKVSVTKGYPVSFYVTVNPPQSYTADVYRIGWYGGLGGRLMARIGPLAGLTQKTCPVDAATGLIECRWNISHALTIPSDWTSGVYLVVLTNEQGFQNYIQFVVRDDARQADLLYQVSVLTAQAYNNYPNDGVTGKSLYPHNSYGAPTIKGNAAAVKVSFDRPYRDDGSGQHFLRWEAYFVRWLERTGYDVAYSTNIDTHASGNRLLNFKAFLSVGHDEYWTKEMRDAVERARDSGVDLGFFGANGVYWQVRLEPSSRGPANRTIVGYKEHASLDPIQGPTTTTQWRLAPVNNPEQQLMGIQYTPGDGIKASYFPTFLTHWVYADTGFVDGDSVADIVGYEVDNLDTRFPGPTAVSHEILSHSPVVTAAGRSTYGESSIYQAPSGAWVFAAGTIQWSWGLDNYDSHNLADPRLQKTTANILSRFILGEPPAP